MQRTQKFLDTRPHRDAGHQTEIVKRLAASGVQESKTPVSSGNMMLNAPSTQVNSVYKTAHTVQDISRYSDYTAGQAVAQSAKTPKDAQIAVTCYSSSVVPEYNDRLASDTQLALKQAAKNSLNNCCRLCGEPIQYTTACPCSLTVAQQNALKDAKRRFTTPS
jgi:hypothetical protein